MAYGIQASLALARVQRGGEPTLSLRHLSGIRRREQTAAAATKTTGNP